MCATPVSQQQRDHHEASGKLPTDADADQVLDSQPGATDDIPGFPRSFRVPRQVWTKQSSVYPEADPTGANAQRAQAFTLSWSNLTFSVPAERSKGSSSAASRM
ncbi:hypothetical protein Gpo141_00008373, partial [Globisporangium polare]